MKKGKSNLLHRGIVPAAVCLLMAAPWCMAAEEGGICLPDQEIRSLQINGIKIPASAGGEKGFDHFAESLEAVRRVDETEATRGDVYHAVTLTFADESKETFYFFPCEDAWYLEDADGSIYQGAEFIEEYVTVHEQSSAPELDLSDLSAMQGLVQTCARLESLGLSISDSDLRAAFVIELQSCRSMYDTEEEAVEAAKDTLTWRFVQYRYACEHGYAPKEEAFEQYRQETDDVMRSARNFKELEAAFEEQDTTYEDYRGAMKEYDRVLYTTSLLINGIQEEFRHGNDRIGDTVCNNAGEYLSAYLLEYVYPEMETYKNETLLPLLEEAERFYREQWTEM